MFGLYRCGCGCEVIPLVDPKSVKSEKDFDYILVGYCGNTDYDDDGLRFNLVIHGNSNIRLEAIQEGHYESTERFELLVDKIRHLVCAGQRLETVQRMLGIEVKR